MLSRLLNRVGTFLSVPADYFTAESISPLFSGFKAASERPSLRTFMQVYMLLSKLTSNGLI
jgi:hypothetical protein